MAATAVQAASKKKAPKSIQRTESPAPSTASADKGSDGDGFESPYIRELQKNMRNVTKKIANAAKVESTLTEHKGKSLDELVAARVINTDQKAQILKKPGLQAQLVQFEEQLVQYQKVHEQYRTRAESEKASADQAIEQAKSEAVNEAKKDFGQTQHANLLIISQFLRLAAYRREEAQDPESDESQAIEGVLLAIYAGDDGAVSSMSKLIEGSEEQILSVPGQLLSTTYSTIKGLAEKYKIADAAEEAVPVDSDTIATDPTTAHAAATEINAGDAASLPVQSDSEHVNGLANASVANEAANAVAGGAADNSTDLSISQEWVDIKATEVETAPREAPVPAAAAPTTQSWADDQPEPVTQAPADGNDGFHQVNRNRGRPDGGNPRGRGRGGEWRGRGGHRGDGRGRGRGGNRGSGVPSRGGPRRQEEA